MLDEPQAGSVVSARDELTELLRWIDVEMGTDVPEVSVPLRRIVARSGQLELIAERAREVVDAVHMINEHMSMPVGVQRAESKAWILDLALTELDNHPATRAPS